MELINKKLTEEQNDFMDTLAHIESVILEGLDEATEESTKIALHFVLDEVVDAILDLSENAGQQAK